MTQYFDPELDLLSVEAVPGEDAHAATNHALRTAPILTGDAFDELTHSVFPQRALYGRIVHQQTSSSVLRDELYSPKVYINTNAPFSALVCGVQGSGKSHSTSVLLESCLMSDGRIGTLPAPLSALVFHFDTAAGGGVVQPCEAAYLSAVDPRRGGDAVPPPVTVLVVPNYLKAMRKVYAGLSGVRVEPLLFSPDDLSGERLLAMMKVDENAQMPLYMESIMAILRSMEDDFNYAEFRQAISGAKFSPSQKAMLNLRLSLLDSCLNGGDPSNSIKSHFRPGQLTIIDLSSPFMDGASACGFFDIILGLFVEADIGATGKLVVLDEAHKYLSESQTGSSARLTDSLLTVIRQQRHLATRVVISTQEPTVVPSKFLDLCSIIIAHRFSSPKWKVLAEHVSAAGSSIDELFEKIVSLKTGQAILFAPNGLCVRSSPATASAASWQAEADAEPHRIQGSVGVLGQGYLIVRSRLRLTLDGGHSLLAVSTPGMTTRLGRVSGRDGGAGAPSDATAPSSEAVATTVLAAVRHLPTPVSSPDASSRTNTGAPVQEPAASLGSTAPSRSPLHVDARAPVRQPQPTISGASFHVHVQSGNNQAESAQTRGPFDHLVPPSSSSRHAVWTMSKYDDWFNDQWEPFVPLLQYMRRGPRSYGDVASMKLIRKHFSSTEPAVFPSDHPEAVDRYVEAALKKGIITRWETDSSSYIGLADEAGDSSASALHAKLQEATVQAAQTSVRLPTAAAQNACGASSTTFGTPSKALSASPPPSNASISSPTSSTARANSVPSSSSTTSMIIDMTKEAHKPFLPLVQYVQSLMAPKSAQNVRIKTIIRHYQFDQPSVFGVDEEQIRQAVATAVRLGLLKEVDAKRVNLVDRAIYRTSVGLPTAATPKTTGADSTSFTAPFKAVSTNPPPSNMTIGSLTSSTARANTVPSSSSSSATNTIIDMTKEAHRPFLPLVQYLQSLPGPYTQVKTIARRYQNDQPGVFGASKKQIKMAVASAVQLGLLTKVDEKRVKLVERAIYRCK